MQRYAKMRNVIIEKILIINFNREAILLLRIYLIRHGETEWNKEGRLQGNSDVKLSAEGIRQAQLLAEHVPFHNVDAIYSSDLSRAVETAKLLAAKFNLPVNTTPQLREINFGDWEGESISDLAKEHPKSFGRFFTAPERCHPPNGETFLEAQARVMNVIRDVIAEHDNQNVVIVSHGAVNRLIIGAALDMPIHKMWAISQFNTALNILRVADGGFVVELINGTDHLQNA